MRSPKIQAIPLDTDLFKPVRNANVFCFWCVTICYVTLVVCAALIAIAVTLALFIPGAWSEILLTNVKTTIGVICSTGGVGALLLHIQERERRQMRQDEIFASRERAFAEAMNLLKHLPNSPKRTQALIHLSQSIAEWHLAAGSSESSDSKDALPSNQPHATQ